MNEILLFFFSSLAIFFAFLIRSVRWRMLLPDSSKCSTKYLILSISIGSAVNALIPFRIGDALRIYVLSRFSNISIGTSAGSVLIERLTDVFSILFILIVFNEFDLISSQAIGFGLALLIFCSIALCSCSRMFRAGLFLLSSVFNRKIKYFILGVCYSSVQALTEKNYISFKYLLLTLLMWGCYGVAYFTILLTIDNEASINTLFLFHRDFFSSAVQNLKLYGYHLDLAYLILMLLPCVFVASVVIIQKNEKIIKPEKIGRISSDFLYPSNVKREFMSGCESSRQSFLEDYFLSKHSSLKTLAPLGLTDCTIVKFYGGGSGALTALVELNNELIVRKVASKSLSNKLVDQYSWLLNMSTQGHNVVNVVNLKYNGSAVSYEMKYDRSAVQFFDFIHTSSVQLSIDKIHNVLDHIENLHKSDLLYASLTAEEYIDAKVIDNINAIESVVGETIDLSNFSVNGVQFNAGSFTHLRSTDFLLNILRDRPKVNVHGDLTIENILIKNTGDIFFIDPNPSGNFCDPLIDFAKLSQSLHYGYEFSVSSDSIKFDANSIAVNIHNSNVYTRLNDELRLRVASRFGQDSLCELDFHEIVHYLRLIPYKFAYSNEMGLKFFGIFCLIYNDFCKRYSLI